MYIYHTNLYDFSVVLQPQRGNSPGQTDWQASGGPGEAVNEIFAATPTFLSHCLVCLAKPIQTKHFKLQTQCGRH